MEPPSQAGGERPLGEEAESFFDSRPRTVSRWARMRRRIAGVLLIVTIFVAFLAPYVFVNVPVGSAGVLWRRFGGTEHRFIIPTGMTMKWPWDIVYIYNLRLQAEHVDIVALTSDALNISIGITYRWFANPESLPRLHDMIGPNYSETLLLPEINASTRRSFSLYSVSDFYGSARQDVMRSVYDAVIVPDADNHICPARFEHSQLVSETPDCLLFLSDVLIRDVALPPRIVAAIQSKIEQKQLVQEMEYRVERERIEAERKLIEAEGIRMFQETVQTGISETYLKWRGIEATVLLATSPNAKTVVIGGNGGLPLILNTGDAAAPVTAQAAAGTGEAAGSASAFDHASSVIGSLDISRPDINLKSMGSSGSASMASGAWSSDMLNRNPMASRYPLNFFGTNMDTMSDTVMPLATLGAQTAEPAVPAGSASAPDMQQYADTLGRPHLSQLINNQFGLGGAVDLLSSLPNAYRTWWSSENAAARSAP
ncbi:prohibitin family protein [Pseudochelatococcus sp. B33]